ncbi:arginyl-tRNA synthetase [Puccinia triticina 1-1 BBBD Race 1]|uniref:arginine--tRNA ligase n=2 Tax=Puccinia triticina TaxID=208348 RepID=A0A180GQE1_PUCT1|nr:uncharacterized protein PtA15_5A187 [Puccinia triticina]OAV94648.1 arginyl-tRNA synthetase [Puccinia triticina 1-1 BBBD Race 1]WAQ84614.1 hypothetical protein PtA15_5A187 [Puccinia triticina]WAR57961.1 hypothetical protein PtB15_5B191 [Puccinia triticina]
MVTLRRLIPRLHHYYSKMASLPSTADIPLLAALPPLPIPPGAEPARNVLDAFRTAVAIQVAHILALPHALPADLERIWAGVESGKKEGGDLTIAVPRFRIKGADPKQLATKIQDQFKTNEWIQSVNAEGSFVKFQMNSKTLCRTVLHQINQLTHLSQTGGGYGTNSSGINPETGTKNKLVLEFSSPNIAKKFHAGHLRSTIIGAFLGNLHEANGWDVTRINYLGDWGRQFGVLAVGFERYGSEKELTEQPIQHLLDVYTKINKDMEGEEKAPLEQKARDFFKLMEEGDPTAVALWKRFRDYSIKQYEQDYARLNIKFDVYSGESQVTHESMDVALKVLKDKGIAIEDNGTLICDLDAYKLGRTVIRKNDGTNLYITRDIGEAIQRYDKYHFDKMIYVVASQQDLHLAQFFKVLDLMGFPWANKLQHINFGMVAGMSTRKGTSVHLEDMMNEARNTMHEQMKTNVDKYNEIPDPLRTADEVGISGIKIQDMAGKRINGYEFKWDRVLSFEGDTGPYLQYAHVRLCSVERKAAPTYVLPSAEKLADTVETAILSEEAKARELVVLLALWPDAVKTAFGKLEPSSIVTYCWKLTHAVSSAWETLIVKGQDQPTALARLWLFRSCKDVLASAMKLLTLEPLERM